MDRSAVVIYFRACCRFFFFAFLWRWWCVIDNILALAGVLSATMLVRPCSVIDRPPRDALKRIEADEQEAPGKV